MSGGVIRSIITPLTFLTYNCCRNLYTTPFCPTNKKKVYIKKIITGKKDDIVNLNICITTFFFFYSITPLKKKSPKLKLMQICIHLSPPTLN